MTDTNLLDILDSVSAYSRKNGTSIGWGWPQSTPIPPISGLVKGDKGIDVSGWQPIIDWNQVKNAGYKFTFIKASEGSFVDKTFVTHWADAKAAGFLRGAYHYFRIEVDPVVQADTLLSVATNNELPLVLDIETQNSVVSAQHFCDSLLLCIGEIEKKTGKKPMIYTGRYVWPQLTGSPLWAKNYQLWIAQYPYADRPPTDSELAKIVPTLPSNWTTYNFWQYTSSGQVSGIKGNVDLDLYNSL